MKARLIVEANAGTANERHVLDKRGVEAQSSCASVGFFLERSAASLESALPAGACR